MKPIVIVETKKNSNGPDRRRWLLQLPNAIEDYRQVVSFNAFFRNVKEYNWKNKKGDWVLYTAKDETEMEIEQRSGLSLYNHEPVAVESLWEFYKLVGFDYKKKKWL